MSSARRWLWLLLLGPLAPSCAPGCACGPAPAPAPNIKRFPVNAILQGAANGDLPLITAQRQFLNGTLPKDYTSANVNVLQLGLNDPCFTGDHAVGLSVEALLEDLTDVQCRPELSQVCPYANAFSNFISAFGNGDAGAPPDYYSTVLTPTARKCAGPSGSANAPVGFDTLIRGCCQNDDPGLDHEQFADCFSTAPKATTCTACSSVGDAMGNPTGTFLGLNLETGQLLARFPDAVAAGTIPNQLADPLAGVLFGQGIFANFSLSAPGQPGGLPELDQSTALCLGGDGGFVSTLLGGLVGGDGGFLGGLLGGDGGIPASAFDGASVSGWLRNGTGVNQQNFIVPVVGGTALVTTGPDGGTVTAGLSPPPSGGSLFSPNLIFAHFFLDDVHVEVPSVPAFGEFTIEVSAFLTVTAERTTPTSTCTDGVVFQAPDLVRAFDLNGNLIGQISNPTITVTTTNGADLLADLLNFSGILGAALKAPFGLSSGLADPGSCIPSVSVQTTFGGQPNPLGVAQIMPSELSIDGIPNFEIAPLSDGGIPTAYIEIDPSNPPPPPPPPPPPDAGPPPFLPPTDGGLLSLPLATQSLGVTYLSQPGKLVYPNATVLQANGQIVKAAVAEDLWPYVTVAGLAPDGGMPNPTCDIASSQGYLLFTPDAGVGDGGVPPQVASWPYPFGSCTVGREAPFAGQVGLDARPSAVSSGTTYTVTSCTNPSLDLNQPIPSLTAPDGGSPFISYPSLNVSPPIAGFPELVTPTGLLALDPPPDPAPGPGSLRLSDYLAPEVVSLFSGPVEVQVIAPVPQGCRRRQRCRPHEEGDGPDRRGVDCRSEGEADEREDALNGPVRHDDDHGDDARTDDEASEGDDLPDCDDRTAHGKGGGDPLYFLKVQGNLGGNSGLWTLSFHTSGWLGNAGALTRFLCGPGQVGTLPVITASLECPPCPLSGVPPGPGPACCSDTPPSIDPAHLGVKVVQADYLNEDAVSNFAGSSTGLFAAGSEPDDPVAHYIVGPVWPLASINAGGADGGAFQQIAFSIPEQDSLSVIGASDDVVPPAFGTTVPLFTAAPIDVSCLIGNNGQGSLFLNVPPVTQCQFVPSRGDAVQAAFLLPDPGGGFVQAPAATLPFEKQIAPGAGDVSTFLAAAANVGSQPAFATYVSGLHDLDASTPISLEILPPAGQPSGCMMATARIDAIGYRTGLPLYVRAVTGTEAVFEGMLFDPAPAGSAPAPAGPSWVQMFPDPLVSIGDAGFVPQGPQVVTFSMGMFENSTLLGQVDGGAVVAGQLGHPFELNAECVGGFNDQCCVETGGRPPCLEASPGQTSNSTEVPDSNCCLGTFNAVTQICN